MKIVEQWTECGCYRAAQAERKKVGVWWRIGNTKESLTHGENPIFIVRPSRILMLMRFRPEFQLLCKINIYVCDKGYLIEIEKEWCRPEKNLELTKNSSARYLKTNISILFDYAFHIPYTSNYDIHSLRNMQFCLVVRGCPSSCQVVDRPRPSKKPDCS